MARWRLKETHYLNVPGTEWEYKEVDRNTGKQGRKVFQVPLHLDPDNPSDQNYPQEGIIVVSDGVGSMPKDIIFVGPPTPDMEPLDEAARLISEAESPRWVHPIESLPGSYSESILADLSKQVSELSKNRASVPAGPVSAGVDPAAFAKIQEQVQELLAQNATLQAQILEGSEPPIGEVRRI